MCAILLCCPKDALPPRVIPVGSRLEPHRCGRPDRCRYHQQYLITPTDTAASGASGLLVRRRSAYCQLRPRSGRLDDITRALDAIHLATARILAPEREALVTYDDRPVKAATDAGLVTVSPGTETA
jgi:hypothetical protein